MEEESVAGEEDASIINVAVCIRNSVLEYGQL
jgi:hypothetical protein